MSAGHRTKTESADGSDGLAQIARIERTERAKLTSRLLPFSVGLVSGAILAGLAAASLLPAVVVRAPAGGGATKLESELLLPDQLQLQHLDEASPGHPLCTRTEDGTRAAATDEQSPPRARPAEPADPSAAHGHRTFVVVGAGPAGLQYARLMQRAGLDFAVLEKAPAAGRCAG